MDNIIDGRSVSETLRKKIKEEIITENINASLCVIQVGDDKASNLYIKNKKRACQEVGINFRYINYDYDTDMDTVIKKIEELNNDDSVNGILVQLPLPSNYDAVKVINAIDPYKDVDGLSYKNIGNLVLNNECLVPCTPLGIMELLKVYDVKLSGKNVCIVGRSNLVGKPLIQL